MPGAQLYDTIGATYTVTRRTEPRIAEQIWDALGNARTVRNVGAGTGSYEPPGRDVTAVEPSAVMRAQRPAGAAPRVDATAESLPFADRSFDAAMAFATIEHWQDPVAGLRETRCMRQLGDLDQARRQAERTWRGSWTSSKIRSAAVSAGAERGGVQAGPRRSPRGARLGPARHGSQEVRRPSCQKQNPARARATARKIPVSIHCKAQ